MLTNLISGSIKQNNITFIEKLPKDLMTPTEKEIVEWLVEYHEQYKSMPTVERFLQTPYDYMYNEILLTTPLDDLYNETINKFKMNAIERAYLQAKEDHNAGREVRSVIFTDLTNSLVAANPASSRSVGSFDFDELIPAPGDYIPLGLDTIDHASGGISRGETALFFAPPGIGKTTYLTFLAVRAARKGYKVLFISKEMSDVRITQRITSILGNFDPFWFIQSAHDSSYISKIKNKATFVKKQAEKYEKEGGDIIIPKAKVYSPNDVRGLINDEINKGGKNFDLVLIDGIHSMHPNNSSPGSFAGDDWRVMRSVSMQLLELAQRDGFETRIVSTSQTKAGVAAEKIGGFTFDDIGYSKGVAEDQSIVCAFSKSDGTYHSPSPKVRFLWAHLLKNRNGENAGGVPATQLKIDYSLMNMYSGETNFNTELSGMPLAIV